MWDSKFRREDAGRGKRGLHRSSPSYYFWLKILENDPYLQKEFERRITESTDGYIIWDFLPGMHHCRFEHKKEQYRRALQYVQDELAKLRKNYPFMNAATRRKILDRLAVLKQLTDRIVIKRNRDVDNHDSIFIAVMEYFTKETPTKNHKEVRDIWIAIRESIDNTIAIFQNQVRFKPSSEQTSESNCTIL